MTGEEKLKSVSTQFARARKGERDKIECPYCGDIFKYGGDIDNWKRPGVSPFCCDSMQAAATAVAQRMMLQDTIDIKKKIEEAVATGRSSPRPSILIH